MRRKFVLPTIEQCQKWLDEGVAKVDLVKVHGYSYDYLARIEKHYDISFKCRERRERYAESEESNALATIERYKTSNMCILFHKFDKSLGKALLACPIADDGARNPMNAP